MVGEFIGVPTESDTDADSTTGQMVKCGMVFARLIGSCSTGSETAVDSRTREVTAAAVARLTQGSRVRM